MYALYSKNKPQSDALLSSHGNEFFKVRLDTAVTSQHTHTPILSVHSESGAKGKEREESDDSTQMNENSLKINSQFEQTFGVQASQHIW